MKICGQDWSRKLWCALMVAVLGLAWPARAQMGIEIRADRDRYLSFEPVNVTITVCNYSGNTLIFGDEKGESGQVQVTVLNKDGMRVPTISGNANPASGLILGAGETKMVTMAINTLYRMQAEGTYTVSAMVEHPRLEKNYRTDPLEVQVVGGSVQWTREIGVPTGSEHGPIRARSVSLVVFSDKRHDQYALQVENAQMVFGVARLGPRITSAPPLCDVDAISNIHALFMVKPRLFEYRVYDWGLRLVQRQYVMMEGSPPLLERDPEVGRIMVKGGRAAVQGVDFVSEDVENLGNNASSLPPVRPPPPPLKPGEAGKAVPAGTGKPAANDGDVKKITRPPGVDMPAGAGK